MNSAHRFPTAPGPGAGTRVEGVAVIVAGPGRSVVTVQVLAAPAATRAAHPVGRSMR